MADGISLSKVSPAFLHANSTSHTWVFSAIAELIDNAYDPDVGASEFYIDTENINRNLCLTFVDNGNGMNAEKLLKMLSFGFCEKDVYNNMKGSHRPIGAYGNGFKSGSMRLGKDAIVFTRQQTTMSIGTLSQTYLGAIKAETVLVPIVSWELPSRQYLNPATVKNNLQAILGHSIYRREEQLLDELERLANSKCSTKIIIYNLKQSKSGVTELDFNSEPSDIRSSETQELDRSNINRPTTCPSEFLSSLREYCSLLFLKPRMKIFICGKKVHTKLISKSLSHTEIDIYRPTWHPKPVKITFGFTCSNKPDSDDYGIMMYHKNRLIKPYEKVGYQKQPNGLGVGVVGVVDVDFLQPIHNKQDFNKDEKYNAFMAAIATKTNDYWNEKKKGNSVRVAPTGNLPDWLWAQCDNCLKWRRLPDGVSHDDLPDKWYCRMNYDATHNRCDIDEEPEDEDEALNRPTYEKKYKKQLEQQKQQQKLEERQQIIQKEQEIRAKEAQLNQMIQQQQNQLKLTNQNGEVVSQITSLQKALAESRRREEMQKRLILQIQEDKKRIEEEQQRARNGTNPPDSFRTPEKRSAAASEATTPPLSENRKRSTENNGPKRKRMSIKTEDGELLTISQNADVDPQPIDLTASDDEDLPVGSFQTATEDVKPDVSVLNAQIEGNSQPVNNDVSPLTVDREAAISKSVAELSKPELRKALTDVRQQLASTQAQLKALKEHVHALLCIIVPDVDLGSTDDVESTIMEMIRVNSEMAQDSEDTVP